MSKRERRSKSAAVRASNARMKAALREHKAVLKRQRQANKPVGLVAMADDWDRGIVNILGNQPNHEISWSRLVNTALKGCRPRSRDERENVKEDIIVRITVLRQAKILGYVRRRFVKLLIPDPPIVWKSIGPKYLPDPDLDGIVPNGKPVLNPFYQMPG